MKRPEKRLGGWRWAAPSPYSRLESSGRRAVVRYDPARTHPRALAQAVEAKAAYRTRIGPADKVNAEFLLTSMVVCRQAPGKTFFRRRPIVRWLITARQPP